ncbi:MAG: carboxypeptidase regulatory-like domain-containing protein, partial [Saprospiraceae bacterium]|nr:carboxypeptidase regulatory-like domain-containing protein [Saprospiraceae bacterium]
MKQLAATILLVAGLYALAFSQTSDNHAVLGAVADESGAPLAFATVTWHRAADSSLVKAGLSDEKGQFALESRLPGGTPTDTYFVRASQLGLQTTNSPVFRFPEHESRQQLNAIRLLPLATDLGEVTVSARKPFIERKMDRLVLNVENSILAAGSSAFEVLE